MKKVDLVMGKKLAVALNMLSPYWYDVFEDLSRKDWIINIFVATEKEKDRKYQVQDYSAYSFKVKRSYDVSVDLSPLKIKTRYFHFQIGLWRDLKDFQPDVILSNELGFRTLLCLLYSKIYKVPVIPWICVSVHTERKNSYLRELIRRHMVKNVLSICTNMSDAKKYLLNTLKIPASKIFHTPYAVNVNTYNNCIQKKRDISSHFKKELGLKGIVFLYVGQTIERKGLRQLIEAVFELKEPYLNRFSLLFIGGMLPEDLLNMLKSKGICFKNISFVQPNDLYQFYAIADVFIFPSLEDEWGIVLNEAASSGLPLISSIYAAATTELVKDGINGFTFDPMNRKQLTNILTTFIDLPKGKRKLIGRASLKIAKSLDIGFTIAQMNLALKRAVQKSVQR